MATTLEMLLQQLAAQNGGGPGLPPVAPSMPIPLVTQTGPPNVPQYGGPSQVVEPPTAPINPNIASQYLNLQGPPPTPPTPLSRGQRIANALMGFGAGLEGRGPEFLAQLNEPRRRYEAQLADFNANRQRLGVMGFEAAQRDVERRTDRAMRLAERQADEEFARESRRLGLYDAESQERLRQAHELERDARMLRLQQTHELELERRKREDRAAEIAGRLGSGPGAAPPQIARELGEFYANVRQSVSPAAAKWVNAQARRAELLARPAVGGGSAAASRRETQDLQRRTAQAAAGIAQMEKLARQAMETTEDKRPPILGQMRSLRDTLQMQFPELLETGEHNNWPFARFRLRGSGGPRQQQPQAQAKIITRAEMQALGITDAQAKGEGYTITP